MSDASSTGAEQEQCVVCGSEEHDGKGWIYPKSDREVVAITENSLERELNDDARHICSIECKGEFKRQLDTDTQQKDNQ